MLLLNCNERNSSSTINHKSKSGPSGWSLDTNLKKKRIVNDSE